MKILAKALAALVMAAAIHGCGVQSTDGAKLAPGEKLQISQKVWNEYQDYLKRGGELGPDREGAFGVVIAGDLGVASTWAYDYCPREYDYCGKQGANPPTRVINSCKSEGLECLIFARNDIIQVPYEIVD